MDAGPRQHEGGPPRRGGGARPRREQQVAVGGHEGSGGADVREVGALPMGPQGPSLDESGEDLPLERDLAVSPDDLGELGPHDVRPRVDRQRRGSRGLLDEGRDPPVVVGDDTAVRASILDVTHVHGPEGLPGPRAERGHLRREVVPGQQVTVEDHDRVGVGQCREALAQAAAGAERCLLDDGDELDAGATDPPDRVVEVLVPVAGRQHDPVDAQRAQRGDPVLDQRPGTDRQQRLGAVGRQGQHPATPPPARMTASTPVRRGPRRSRPAAAVARATSRRSGRSRR
ncbi:hypothetical protein LP422_23325 [Janibacter limosus]|nr:hypothetical protein LP422_23325 [Janibacter limosus]